MNTADAIAPAREPGHRIPLAHRGKRARFFGAEGTDELVSMVLELTAELWVLKKRLYLLEKVAGRSGLPLSPGIESYALDPAEVDELDRRRHELIATVLRSLEADPDDARRVRDEMESLGTGQATAEVLRMEEQPAPGRAA